MFTEVVHKQRFGPEAAHDVTNGLTYIDIVKRYIGHTAYAGLSLHSASENPQDSVKIGAKGAEYVSCVVGRAVNQRAACPHIQVQMILVFFLCSC